MRTTLNLPDGLVEEAQKILGFQSKTDTVVAALKELIRRERIEDLIRVLEEGGIGYDPALRKKR